MAYLESFQVAEATRKDYSKKATSFLQWARESDFNWKSVKGLDDALALYMDRLFFMGMAGDVASKTVAAVKFYYPEVGRYGDQSLPRSVRALAGWASSVPRKTRMPMLAIVGHLLPCSLIEQAVAALL
eukprot:3388299-Pyramimonas_sp.AAC.1